MDAEKINAAARQVLDACYSSPDPVVTIGQEIDGLRLEGTWTGAELRQLQASVLAVLRGLVDDEDRERPIRVGCNSGLDFRFAVRRAGNGIFE